jgi:hypothetical protein
MTMRTIVAAISCHILIQLPLASADFSIKMLENDNLRILYKEEVIAEYIVDQANKPYLYPIYGPTGASMTRNYPMKHVDGERQDHPHHRGLNFGHEGINGVDTWSEAKTWEEIGEKRGHDNEYVVERKKALGRIAHKKYEKLDAMDSSATVVQICEYHSGSGCPVLQERRTMIFRVEENRRVIDFDQELIAAFGDASFEDKKDSGLSIRIPTSMDVTSELGGTIINSEGDRDKSAWSKRARWCDYNGPVDGKRVGVAMLNHPSSFCHPTGWHVRTYGLLTANPFASKQFDKNAPDAGFVLKTDETLLLRHRFIFHVGDEKQANIEQAWQSYAKEKK